MTTNNNNNKKEKMNFLFIKIKVNNFTKAKLFEKK